MTKPKKPELIDIELSGKHTHAGRDCQAGDTISVTPRQKAFLEGAGKVAARAGIAERVEATEAP